MRFSNEDEAVEIANGIQYGLTAALCTKDEARAWFLAQRLEAGMIFVNNYMRPRHPWLTVWRHQGKRLWAGERAETLYEFVRSKNIRFPSGRGTIPTWPPQD